MQFAFPYIRDAVTRLGHSESFDTTVADELTQQLHSVLPCSLRPSSLWPGFAAGPWPKEAQVSRLDEQVRADPTIFYSAEAERMARVQKNLVIIEYVELFIIVATAAAAVSLKLRPGLAGIALGLLISASLLLAFDLLAERRGAEYVAALGHGKRLGTTD